MVKRFFKRFYLGLLLLFIYMPIFVLIVFSFSSGDTMGAFQVFSLKHYADLFKDPAILEAIWVTLSVAVLSSAIAVVLGTLAAIGINEYKRGTRNLVINITYVPMMNADIVTGISLLLLFIFMDIPRGYGTLLIAHVVFNVPYVIFAVLPKLKRLDRHLYEAALDMGATPAYALWKVVVPQLAPGIFTGFIMAFTMSFDDFLISFFSTQGMVNNLAGYIYSMTKKGVDLRINALSTIMFIIVVTLLIIINIRSSREDKKVSNKRSM